MFFNEEIILLLSYILICFRRRSSTTATKPTTSPPTNVGKKNIPPSTSKSTPATKPGIKSSDKAPLLEPTINITAPAPIKRKLVPERTVQISDVNTSRFKSSTGTTTASTTAGQAGTTGKETSSASSEAVATPPAPIAVKPVLTAADSGIYGADLSDPVPPPIIKQTSSSVEPTKIYGIDLPDKSESTHPIPSVTVVVNPLSEKPIPSLIPAPTPASTPTNIENTTISAIAVPNNVKMSPLPNENEVLLHSILNDQHFDPTVKSAYSSLIDATISENEGTIGGGSVVSSASQSRRTSYVKQPLLSHEANNIQAIPRKTTPFNPLHMILRKDANKYYTTEYI
jgi:hypothetical protein